MGTSILLDLGTEDRWTLVSTPTGWDLGPHQPDTTHDSEVRASPHGGWRWLTGAMLSAGDLHIVGPAHLCDPLLEVRAILV